MKWNLTVQKWDEQVRELSCYDFHFIPRFLGETFRSCMRKCLAIPCSPVKIKLKWSSSTQTSWLTTKIYGNFYHPTFLATHRILNLYGIVYSTHPDFWLRAIILLHNGTTCVISIYAWHNFANEAVHLVVTYGRACVHCRKNRSIPIYCAAFECNELLDPNLKHIWTRCRTCVWT